MDRIAANSAPTPVAKVSAAGPHPVTPAAGAHRRELVQNLIEPRRSLVVMSTRTPVVEPATPQLADDHWVLGPARAGLLELLGNAAPAIAKLGPVAHRAHTGVLRHLHPTI